MTAVQHSSAQRRSGAALLSQRGIARPAGASASLNSYAATMPFRILLASSRELFGVAGEAFAVSLRK
jgi:hypothetical protein